MNDLGFGMLDKRSVAAILFSLGLAYALGLQIPIDTSNMANLFVGIVLFTGALYISRSIFRLIFILLFSINKQFRSLVKYDVNYIKIPEWVGMSDFSLAKASWYIFDSKDGRYKLRVVARILGRLVLIVFVLIASLPTIRQYSNTVGLIGICVMLIIYISKGGFTLLVKDSIDASDENDLARAKMTAEEIASRQPRETPSYTRDPF